MSLQSSNDERRLSSLAPRFLLYAEVELCFAPQSLIKYRDCLRQIERMLGDRTVESFTREDVLSLKSKMLAKRHSVSRQVSILSAFKRILQFAREELGVQALDPATVVVPARPRREVVFLSVEEVERFVSAIKIETLEGKPSLSGLRFRAIVETLLGSAMRIGEVLSLDREDIDFQNREAKIVGKGNKQRTAFFTDRALFWIRTYLETRDTDHPALFVCQDGRTRLKRADMWRPFRRYRKIAAINKPVTPHLLRHTAATQLLFNGCPIGHIKEILGHERLETTCRYYLGLDHRAAKQAHSTYLVYGATDGHELTSTARTD